jgi:predicted transcriptional regulator
MSATTTQPKRTKARHGIFLSPDLKRALEEAAIREETTASEITRRAVREFLQARSIQRKGDAA